MAHPDTPGRPTPAGSRQQSHPKQGVQSGSSEIDAKDTGSRPEREAAKRYQDRPTDDGKHGDAAQEPNEPATR